MIATEDGGGPELIYNYYLCGVGGGGGGKVCGVNNGMRFKSAAAAARTGRESDGDGGWGRGSFERQAGEIAKSHKL